MEFVKSAAMLAASVALATAPASGTEDQATSAARTDAWTELPDWSGTWWVDQPGILDTSTADLATEDRVSPGDRTHPPYTAEYERRYQETIERGRQGHLIDPAKVCMPAGMPRLLSRPFGVNFLVTPEITHITWEYDAQVRRIYTDGRDMPNLDETFPSWTGYSVGHWEGDTLVVETVGIKEPRTIDGAPDQTIDRTGGVLSGQHTITERIRKTEAGTMEIEVTITDPVALTRPWTFKKTFSRAPAGEFVSDYIYCHSPIISGNTKFPLPTTREEYYEWMFETGPLSPSRVHAETASRLNAEAQQ